VERYYRNIGYSMCTCTAIILSVCQLLYWTVLAGIVCGSEVLCVFKIVLKYYALYIQYYVRVFSRVISSKQLSWIKQGMYSALLHVQQLRMYCASICTTVKNVLH